jgi:uncharacterized protein Yka (UPF0111/DUF47 family)
MGFLDTDKLMKMVEEELRRIEEKVDKMYKEMRKRLDEIHSTIIALETGDLKFKKKGFW